MKRYAGKVKLIYLDPPYNTGSDSFVYNDKFNHAAWLTFMKNRLEISKRLLSDEGVIFIEIDHNEDAYLKILADNIFNRKNYVTTITVRSNSISGNKTAHKEKTILKNKDSILVYKKHDTKFNPQYAEKNEWDTHYNKYYDRQTKTVKSLKDVLVQKNILKSTESIKPDIWKNLEFKQFAYDNRNNIFRFVNSISENLKNLSLENPDKVVSLKGEGGNKLYAKNGKRLSFLENVYQKINNKYVPGQLLGDLWTDIDFQNTQNQGSVSFTNAKKPEQLLQRIIALTSKENDIVLDFFMGSGTTQAVAMKMKRHFIGIEQMDYINTVSVPRLQKVIAGEQGGISKTVDWQGGGSFIYAELMEKNQGFIMDLKKQIR